MHEAVRLDNMNGFNNLIDTNTDLADEYFEKRKEKMEKIELPAEFNTEEWRKKMLDRIYKALEE